MPKGIPGCAVCSVDGCERVVKGHGWCSMHYQRWKKHGDPLPPIRTIHSGTLEERFWAKVNKDGPIPPHRPELGPCWEWTACGDERGYGKLGTDGGFVRPYRYAIELLVGPIPDGLEPDHLCRNPACTKAVADKRGPAHLELVTHHENLLRGNGPSGRNARKTHCPQGHEYTPENTLLETKRGGRLGRRCRECTRALERARYAAKAEGS
jgi:hypothetical protein